MCTLEPKKKQRNKIVATVSDQGSAVWPMQDIQTRLLMSGKMFSHNLTPICISNKYTVQTSCHCVIESHDNRAHRFITAQLSLSTTFSRSVYMCLELELGNQLTVNLELVPPTRYII